MSSIQQLFEKASTFVKELSRPFVGRDEEALVISLGVLTGEHVILVGEPGTAKSAMARRAAELINARFFKYLLTRFTEPDELFGPIDINALKVGKYVRITNNKLPEAEIAFIDEIFNANSAILNTLLTLMNERIIYDGYNEIRVPLWTLISASNNVPDEPELQALYDRFLFRHFVRPVEEDKWSSLLDAAWEIEIRGFGATRPVLSMDEIRELNKLVLSVDVKSVKDKVLRLFAIFEDQGIHITDRRKGKSLKALAAMAVINGRMKVVEEDLMVLKYIIARDREEYEKVYGILLEEVKASERLARELSEIENNVKEAFRYIGKLSDLDPRLVDYLRSFESVKERVRKLAEEAGDQRIRERASKLLVEVEELIEVIRKKLSL
ncbi:ATPase associated with various cellular activities, AAA_5 [Thermogladius calderae 1633]|uniref:ATPase associated with various cellular activities, AAA_5 n=1 Tax=Thermogladius calderae (strain DSM 22663 / VKM B-2946 / 1633) TaxID=1184251 RepID=I3TEJ7_THEC1|nr:AAA family ATPase [Thermogladius calderae]AFK51185.1 ATPase associated with various cellular activities, AAA_5 [Thermogladius calderae 1633]